MKKILVCLLAWIMLLSLCACGRAEPETIPPLVQDETVPVVTEPAVEEPTAPPTEAPTEAPTEEPTEAPTEEPTEAPTEALTEVEVTVPQVDPAPEMTDAQRAFGEAVVQTAREQLDKLYVYGGAGPEEFDNSGLPYYCFQVNGVSIPRVTEEQAKVGYEVERDALCPGDLVFFWDAVPNETGFSGIYVGDNQMIISSGSKGSVRLVSIDNTYYDEHFTTARRYLVE